MIFSIRVVLAKEKMGKSIEDIKKGSEKQSKKLATNIVIGIDNSKKITRFNKECERILGYNLKEVLNKPIFDFLIPNRYINQWKYLIDNSRKNKMMDDFKLPLLTKKGHEIWISWSNFPAKNTNGSILDISFVGNLISTIKEDREPLIEFSRLETKEKTIDRSIDNNSKKEKSENYLELKKMVKNLKSKNSNLEKKNKNLNKDLKTLKNQINHLKKKKDKKKRPEKQIDKDINPLPEFVETKKINQDSTSIPHELDEREKTLKNLESKLLKDKIKINNQVNEFRKWRIKLESLEKEIDNRQKELITKEKLLTENIKSSEEKILNEPKEEKVIKHDLLDKIPDSAVVIHRGILKQVNDSFAELIGYDINEILDKSLFDFIIPEDLSEVQDYYINKLKGVEVSTYETTFLTKQNEKISVEISTKPTNFNGKKAEIAIVKELKNKK
jgi:PAS domain S-box-containing protein